MERIEHLVLRIPEAVSPHLQRDGSCVLRRADCGRYAVVSPIEWAVLSRIDGTRTVSDLARGMLEQRQGLGLRAVLDRIVTLRTQGFLAPDTAPVRPARDRTPGRLALGPRLRLPMKVETDVRVWPWLAAAVLAFATAAAGLLTGPLPKVAIHGSALPAVWASVAVILSLRSLAAAAVLAQARTRPWQVGVAWTWWVLHVWVDSRDVRAAGHRARAALAVSELTVVALVLAAVSWSLRVGTLSGDLGAGVFTGAAATLWWTLRPFGAGPLIELARAVTGQETIWHDARSYLLRRLWRQMARHGDLFASERTFAALAVIYPLWGYAGLALFSRALEQGLFPALGAALGGTGVRRMEAWTVLTVAAGGLAVAIGAPLIGSLAWAVRRWRESRSGRIRPVVKHELDAIVGVLASTPLFATLPRDTLQAMARDSSLMDLTDRAVAVRQGTRGDRAFIIRRGRVEILHEHDSGRSETVAVLSAGDVFGEMALLGDGMRTATAQAVGPCQVIAVSHGAFQHGIAATGLRQEEVTSWLHLARRLRQSPLFADMSPAEVACFLRRAVRRAVAPGDILIREGDPGNHFYVVLSGRFEVSTGGRQTAVLGPGDFAGEIALLAAGPRTATVTARESSEVLQLGRDEFLDTLASDLTFGFHVSETARRRVEGTPA